MQRRSEGPERGSNLGKVTQRGRSEDRPDPPFFLSPPPHPAFSPLSFPKCWGTEGGCHVLRAYSCQALYQELLPCCSFNPRDNPVRPGSSYFIDEEIAGGGWGSLGGSAYHPTHPHPQPSPGWQLEEESPRATMRFFCFGVFIFHLAAEILTEYGFCGLEPLPPLQN